MVSSRIPAGRFPECFPPVDPNFLKKTLCLAATFKVYYLLKKRLNIIPTPPIDCVTAVMSPDGVGIIFNRGINK